MTVPATPRRVGPYYGNGVTTSFPFTFKCFTVNDISLTATPTGVAAIPLVRGVDYNVTLNPDQNAAPGGTITYPIIGSPMPVGTTLAGVGSLAYDQTSSFPPGGSYRAITHENAFDRTVTQIQQLAERADRAISVPAGESISTLPPASSRANTTLGFDGAGNPITVTPISGSAADVVAQLSNTADSSKGDALIGVKQPYTGAASRTQHQKNADFISLADFPGAVNDGVTNVDLCVTAAEFAAVTLNVSSIYLPPGSWAVSGGYVFTCRYWGPGNFVYTGRSNPAFTGAGLNDLTLSGTAIGTYPLTVWVEPTTTDNPNKYRFSLDAGVTWTSTTTTVLPGDIEVTTDLVMTTTPQALGHTGVSIAWGAVTGHTVGNRWTFTLRPNPKVFDGGNALVLRNQIAGWIDGDRSVAFGQNVLNFGRSISFENVGVGVDVLSLNQTGYGNVAMGVRAGQSNRTGFLNTYMGVWAGRDATTADGNTAIGAYSQVVGSTGGFNTSVGNDALTFPNAGTENCAFGVQALHGNDEVQTGWNPQRNCAFGVQAMRDVENAAFNCAYGFGVAPEAKSVQGLAAFGYASFTALTTGNDNTGLGTQTGSKITTGLNNVFIGSGSGNAVGQKVDAVNSIAIGVSTFTTANNQIVIGNNQHTACFLYGNFLPQTDNGQSVGMGAARWSVIYAGTGTINTSDERYKTPIRPITEAERRVALWLKGRIGAFKFLDAIEEKGDGARWHFGVGAQTVAAAFSDEGLDAAHYGLFCHDEWPEEVVEWEAQPDADPPVEAGRKVIREAGNRYGVRYDELAMFILAAL